MIMARFEATLWFVNTSISVLLAVIYYSSPIVDKGCKSNFSNYPNRTRTFCSGCSTRLSLFYSVFVPALYLVVSIRVSKSSIANFTTIRRIHLFFARISQSDDESEMAMQADEEDEIDVGGHYRNCGRVLRNSDAAVTN